MNWRADAGGVGSATSEDDLPSDDVSYDIVVVALEGQRYGLPVDAVMELHRMVATTPLPGAPVVIEGVINVRGSAVPVLDLRARLQLHSRPAQASDHLVLARAGEAIIGLRVDRVIELIRLPSAAVDHAVGSVAPHLEAVAALDDGLLLVHDVTSFLFADEEAALREALEAFAVDERV